MPARRGATFDGIISELSNQTFLGAKGLSGGEDSLYLSGSYGIGDRKDCGGAGDEGSGGDSPIFPGSMRSMYFLHGGPHRNKNEGMFVQVESGEWDNYDRRSRRGGMVC